MKEPKYPEVFFDQPPVGSMASKHVLEECANGNTLNTWLQRNPPLLLLKAAALVEGQTKKRVLILNRLLTRIYKLEKAATLAALTK